MTRHASPPPSPPPPCTHPSHPRARLARSNLRPSSRPASRSLSRPSPRSSSAPDKQRESRQSRGNRAGRESSLHGSRRHGASRAPHRTAWSSCSAGTAPCPPPPRRLGTTTCTAPALHPHNRPRRQPLGRMILSLPPPLPSLLPRYRPPALRSGRALQLCACNKEDLAMWLSALSSQIDAHQAAADANRRRASARSSSSEADAGTDANAPAADAGVATADRAAAAIGEPIRIKLYKKEAAAKLGARRTGPDPPELLRRTSAPFPLLLPAQRCRPRTPPRRRPTAHRRPHRHPNRRPHPWRRH